MKTSRLILALVAAVGLSSFALAADEAATVTLTGNIACAKCTLHVEGMKDCQNVLVVEADGATKEYYVESNAVAKEFGHACKGEKAAVVTGVVSEKDGKTWITPTKMDKPSA
jgi:Family of unknown function (DUF6370)